MKPKTMTKKHDESAADFHEFTGLNVDSHVLDAASVKVEETEDAWVIRGTVLTKDGVMNRARKMKDELARTWAMAEGIPTTHEHPDFWSEMGVVIDLRRAGGVVRNVRFRDADGAVLGDVHLLKRSVAGRELTEENAVRNRQIIAAVQAGEPVEVSIGFWSTDEWLSTPVPHNGAEFDRIQREIVYDHLALVPKGACSWEDGCGLGRAQGNTDHRKQQTQDHARRHRARGHPAQGDGTMADGPHQDCEKNKDELQRRLTAAESRADAAEKATKAADSRVAALEGKMTEVTTKADRAFQALEKAEKARLDDKRTALATLVGRKAEELPAMDEAALDFTITREREYRGRADGTRLRGAGAKDEASQDGVQESEFGFTVADWSKVGGKAVN